MTAKYRLPSYSSYNEICLGRVNIATARGKLRRQAAKWRTVATVAVQNFAIFMGFPTGSPEEASSRLGNLGSNGSLGMRHEECVGRTSFANNRHKFGAATN